MIEIKVFDLFGKNCTTLQDGVKLYEMISHDVFADKKVFIDFDGVEVITAIFLNKAFGPFFAFMSDENFKSLVEIRIPNRQYQQLLDLIFISNKNVYMEVVNDVIHSESQ